MKRLFKTLLCVAVFFAALFPLCGAGEAKPPAVGDQFPELKFPLPENKEARQYLGVKKGGHMRIQDIKADLVIVEVLSMYCPFCQTEAPKMNELFARIENNPELKGKVKIIGIAAGNSPYEAGVFSKKYAVPFPVFSDADFTLHKNLGEVRTPYFIGVRLEGKKGRVFYSKLGAFENSESFLKQMIDESGLGEKGELK